MPGLRSRPFPDPRRLPWLSRLEAATAAIRRELHALRRAGLSAEHRAQGVLVREGSWRESLLWNRGRPCEPAFARCPRTLDAVARIDGALEAGLVYFSVLAPHTQVEPHCGPINTRWRCHLGLEVPDGCRLEVAGETRTWREGECLVFDDSFVHEAENASDRARVVLIVDVWHPDLTADERATLTAFFERTAHGARPLEAVGALGAFAHPVLR